MGLSVGLLSVGSLDLSKTCLVSLGLLDVSWRYRGFGHQYDPIMQLLAVTGPHCRLGSADPHVNGFPLFCCGNCCGVLVGLCVLSLL